MQRVRNLDELSFASVKGYTNTSGTVINRSYTIAALKLLGRKKVTIDYPRPLRDFRYDMIPTVKNKLYKRTQYVRSTYRGRKPLLRGRRVTSFVKVSYTRYVNLRRPKKTGSESNGFIRLNNFYVAQVLGFCTSGVLKTPKLPEGWTTWNMTGNFAAEAWGDALIQPTVGFDLYDLSRPLTLDMAYANVALARSAGKVSAPDVDFAEIIGEFDQLCRLLEDPFKSVSALLRKFQRFFAEDAWIAKPRVLKNLGAISPKRLAYNAMDIPTLLSGSPSIMTFRTRRKVGRRRLAEAAVSEAANRWLQYRYGVVPLVSDITEILRKFSDKIRPLVKIHTAKTTVVAKRTTKTWLVTRASVIPGFTLTYRITVSCFDRYTAKVYYRSNLFDKFVDIRDLGLDKSNLLPVLWELTPWSFVVDWFIGVEAWFRSWNLDPKLTLLGNCVSRKRDTNVQIQIVSATYYGYSCQVPQSRFYAHRAELARQVNLPVPEYPVFNPDFLKWRRVLDSLSLLWAKMPALRR